MEHRFEIEIARTEGCTWSGLLHTQAGLVPFLSELELLFALERCVGGTQASEKGSEPGELGRPDAEAGTPSSPSLTKWRSCGRRRPPP